ncbi:neugrin isoform X2 [Thalassophryne amazonica]|nr:neugrin isoform X2 [Thalassophryne amazonica]
MAKPLRVLCLFPRLVTLSVRTSVSTNSCRFVSRGTRTSWEGKSHVRRTPTHSQGPSEEESVDEGDVEGRLQQLFLEEKRRARTVKHHILRRKMTPSGAPERKLTWDAIEQIRYLKQEHPEEWTVQRLAEGFSVTPDVILRVLRSKFIPAPERKVKQDTKVLSRISQQILPSGVGAGQDRPRLPGSGAAAAAALSPGSKETSALTVTDQMVALRGQSSGSVSVRPAALNIVPAQLSSAASKHVSVPMQANPRADSAAAALEEDGEDGESWDGQLFSEEELFEFMLTVKSSPVAQIGSEFFDAEGKFLYRI